MVLKNCKLFDKIADIKIENGVITQIGKIEENGIDVANKLVIPGLVDVHIHGLCGIDTMDADLEPLCIELAKRGTTSFLPTTMTMPDDDLLKVVNCKIPNVGSNVLGFHFEGPYINPDKCGAQDKFAIKKADKNHFSKFRNVKMITVAPEMDGANEFIEQISDKCVVSIGHTNCKKEDAVLAFEKGAKCLTHTFNAMPPMLHRAPGPIGAAVECGGYAQLICDGLHVEKSVVLAAYKMFGRDRLTFISDSIRPAYCKNGIYNCGGIAVTLKDNVARLKDGTLAGSSSCLMDCVRKAVEFGIPLQDAVIMASQTPSELLGVKKGRIEVGYDADLLVLNDDLSIEKVIIGGKAQNEV